jgi:hypothetical protein
MKHPILVFIKPAAAHSTSYVERQSLTLRMTQKRFARLTNGFSKKLANHAACGQPVRLSLQPVPQSTKLSRPHLRSRQASLIVSGRLGI